MSVPVFITYAYGESVRAPYSIQNPKQQKNLNRYTSMPHLMLSILNELIALVRYET